MSELRTIIIKPLITEKATRLRDRYQQYVFQVARDANRIEIKRAIEQKFKVGVTKVKTVTIHGRQRRSIGRYANRRKHPDWKKAVVTLRKGDTIEVFEGV